MKLGALSAATATSTLVLGAVVRLAPGQSTPPTQEHSAHNAVLKFDHAQHAALDKPVAIAACATCHGDDKGGVLAQPAQVGHQPCFSSGCHAGDFLSVGPRTRKEAPERYAKAAAFCQGCHQVEAGSAPSPAHKMSADNTYKNNSNPGHYVEFNHFEHSERTKCRSCHVVDAKSFALSRPVHAQCATCHKDNEEQDMSKCASCHRDGSPASYFKARKFDSDVRSCRSNSPRATTPGAADAAKAKVPCFEHEHQGHRFRTSGEAVQCIDCHFMFKSKSFEGHRYVSLLDVKQAPLMDNRRDEAHQKCGAAGCHSSDVDESQGTGRCGFCHSKRTILNDLLDSTPTRPVRSSEPTSRSRRGGKKLNDLIEGGDKPRSRRRGKRDSFKDLLN